MAGNRIVRTALAAFALAAATPMAFAWGGAQPALDQSPTTRQLEALPRPVGARKVVTIYEFRSSVAELPARGATDMFTTALIKSGAFAVAERSRLTESEMQERQLNSGGVTTGDTATHKLAGADFIFEGTVSEMTQGVRQDGNSVSIGGMTVSSDAGADEIGIDVRVVDANTGLVLDSVDVHQRIESTHSGVANVGNLLGTVASLGGRSLPIAVDANTQSTHHDSVDRAMRACIETAVLELVKRYGKD